jgi:hypothetical protein
MGDNQYPPEDSLLELEDTAKRAASSGATYNDEATALRPVINNVFSVTSLPLDDNHLSSQFPSSEDSPKMRNLRRIILLAAVILTVSIFSIGGVYIVHGRKPSSTIQSIKGVTITFARTTKTIEAPATITIASDGKGQVPAQQLRASISHVASDPIQVPAQFDAVSFTITAHNSSSSDIQSPAGRLLHNNSLTCQLDAITIPHGGWAYPKCSFTPTSALSSLHWTDTSYTNLTYDGYSPAVAANYSVPDKCGDATTVTAAVRTVLQEQLQSQIPTGMVALPALYSISMSTLTCTPGSGTKQSTPFTYVQYIDGSASQLAYSLDVVKSYQLDQLNQSAKQLGSGFTINASQLCTVASHPTIVSNTTATLTCAATGIASWNWDASSREDLARTLAGKTVEDALTLLRANPGIVADSITTTAASGTQLPVDPKQIEIIIKN